MAPTASTMTTASAMAKAAYLRHSFSKLSRLCSSSPSRKISVTGKSGRPKRGRNISWPPHLGKQRLAIVRSQQTARARGYSDRSRLDESRRLRETCKVHPRATISGLLRPAHVAPDPIRRSPAPAPAYLFQPPRTEPASLPLRPAGDARRMARLCDRPSPGDGGVLGIPPQPRPTALFDREAPD